MGPHLERLLSIAGPPLGRPGPLGHAQSVTAHFGALAELLEAANGFYAFESALHVFPSAATRAPDPAVAGRSLEEWNEPALWRSAYPGDLEGCIFFAEDAFGGQFALTSDGVAVFDPETGALEPMAGDLDEWAAQIMADYEVLTAYPLAHEWQAAHGPLPPGQRLVPKQPFVLGGEYAVTNLYALDAVESMQLRADLARQLRDLPDGAQIRYRVVD